MRSDAQTLEQRAAYAIAKRYSATLASWSGKPSAARSTSAELIVGGQPVALEMVLLSQAPSPARRDANQGARPRLREDRVAQRVLRDLESRLNPQLSDGRTIILTLGALHGAIAKSPRKRTAAQRAGKRWLALVAEDWIADFKTYQRAYTKISPPHGYDRILKVSASGRVEVLVDASQTGKH